jgi:threonine/homoserine efflux transporter RhtA
MSMLPVVWVPALCWVLLVVLGLWFLYQGIRASWGPRDPMVALWAVNEMAIVGALIWWGVYVPDTWRQADLINFALEGIYLGFLIGAFVRLLLAMRGPGSGAAHRDESFLGDKARHWLGRFRRY